MCAGRRWTIAVSDGISVSSQGNGGYGRVGQGHHSSVSSYAIMHAGAYAVEYGVNCS